MIIKSNLIQRIAVSRLFVKLSKIIDEKSFLDRYL